MRRSAEAGDVSGAVPREPLGPLVLGQITAAMVIVATLPFWLLSAGMVWASVGRPLLFRQIRSGLGGRPFVICKFRTMRDTCGPNGMLLPDAMRQTPTTRLLRTFRLDELPQLLAILRGDMAFVGPRPLLPTTIEAFGDLGRVRCTVLPGLTGWAQVNGNTRLDRRQKLALDLWYINNRSLALDIKILAMTGTVLIRGERLVNGNIARATAEMKRLDTAAADGLRR